MGLIRKEREDVNSIVIYKTKYGSTKAYAEWIAEALGCKAVDCKTVKAEELCEYDAIVYGGGLYAEVINGVSLITKNIKCLQGKKIAVFTTGITPIDCRDYYDTYVIQKNFKDPEILKSIKLFNYPGKMVLSELSVVHRTALKTLKKIMQGKENPTQMEKLLVELCDADGDFSDKTLISDLVNYIKA